MHDRRRNDRRLASTNQWGVRRPYRGNAMTPTTNLLMFLRRYPTDLGGRAKTRKILRELAATATGQAPSRGLPAHGPGAHGSAT